jgi:glycosyltransferase involved in cell wall biosynthesis
MECAQEKIKNELRASIVIPFHGCYNLLARTIVSLTQQSYPKDLFEVIIVADANHHLAKHLADVYGKEITIKLLNPFNDSLCLSSSRNAGIRVAKGDVIVSLDSDMICPPAFLESHMKWFHRHPKIATIGLRKFVRADGIRPEEIIHCFYRITCLPEIHSISNTYGSRRDKRITEIGQWTVHPFPSNCFHGGNVAYWRDDAIDVGLWDDEFNGNYGYEDIDFGQRLHENHTNLIIENGATTYHQENNSIPTKKRVSGLKINRAKLYERFPALARFRREILGVQ